MVLADGSEGHTGDNLSGDGDDECYTSVALDEAGHRTPTAHLRSQLIAAEPPRGR